MSLTKEQFNEGLRMVKEEDKVFHLYHAKLGECGMLQFRGKTIALLLQSIAFYFDDAIFGEAVVTLFKDGKEIGAFSVDDLIVDETQEVE